MIGINAGNQVDLVQNRDYLESPCECGIELPGSISHGVSYMYTSIQVQFWSQGNPKYNMFLFGLVFTEQSLTQNHPCVSSVAGYENEMWDEQSVVLQRNIYQLNEPHF